MSQSKSLRKKIRGHKRALAKHLHKLAEELEKPEPDDWLVRKWRKDIASFERIIAKLERQLPGGKK